MIYILFRFILTGGILFMVYRDLKSIWLIACLSLIAISNEIIGVAINATKKHSNAIVEYLRQRENETK